MAGGALPNFLISGGVRIDNKQLLDGLVNNLGKDALWYVPGRIVPALLGFLVLSVYTRLFTPEDYGNYSLILATVSMLTIFTSMWLNNSNLRFFPAYRNNKRLDEYFSTTFFIIGISVILTSTCFYTLVELRVLSGALFQFALVIVGLLFSSSFFQTLLTILRSDRRANYVSLFTCISSGMSIVFTLALIFIFHAGVIAIPLGQLMIDVIICAVIMFKFGFIRHIRWNSFSVPAFKEFVAFGSPFILMSVCNWILAYSDRYIIEFFQSKHEVGIYYAASQLGTMPTEMISTIAIMAGLPILIDNYEKNGEKYAGSLITFIIKYFLLIMIPLIFGIYVLAPDFSSLIGNLYMEGSAIIPVIALGTAFQGLRMYTSISLQLKKKTIIMSVIMILVAAVQLASNLVLIPAYGIAGAAFSSVIAGVFFVAATWVISIRILYWKFPVGSFVKSVISSVVMCAGVFIVKMIVFPQPSPVSFVVLVILGVSIYFLFIVRIGELRGEFRLIKERIMTDARVIKVMSRSRQ